MARKNQESNSGVFHRVQTRQPERASDFFCAPLGGISLYADSQEVLDA